MSNLGGITGKRFSFATLSLQFSFYENWKLDTGAGKFNFWSNSKSIFLQLLSAFLLSLPHKVWRHTHHNVQVTRYKFVTSLNHNLEICIVWSISDSVNFDYPKFVKWNSNKLVIKPHICLMCLCWNTNKTRVVRRTLDLESFCEIL